MADVRAVVSTILLTPGESEEAMDIVDVKEDVIPLKPELRLVILSLAAAVSVVDGAAPPPNIPENILVTGEAGAAIDYLSYLPVFFTP
jgi:hypothetical protein